MEHNQQHKQISKKNQRHGTKEQTGRDQRGGERGITGEHVQRTQGQRQWGGDCLQEQGLDGA